MPGSLKLHAVDFPFFSSRLDNFNVILCSQAEEILLSSILQATRATSISFCHKNMNMETKSGPSSFNGDFPPSYSLDRMLHMSHASKQGNFHRVVPFLASFQMLEKPLKDHLLVFSNYFSLRGLRQRDTRGASPSSCNCWMK